MLFIIILKANLPWLISQKFVFNEQSLYATNVQFCDAEFICLSVTKYVSQLLCIVELIKNVFLDLLLFFHCHYSALIGKCNSPMISPSFFIAISEVKIFSLHKFLHTCIYLFYVHTYIYPTACVLKQVLLRPSSQ